MIIEEGKYYVLQTTEPGWEHEKYIMKIQPRPNVLPEQIYRTETLGLHNGQMWVNDWAESYIQREATPEEIDLFLLERNKYGIKLPGIGEMVTGMKLETLDDTVTAIKKIVGREGQTENPETPISVKLFEGKDLGNLEELDWQQLSEKLEGRVVTIDLSQTETTSINPLDPDGENKTDPSLITVAAMVGPFGEVKSYEEVSKQLDITYDEWKNAADKIEEFRRILKI
ncbi:hypothetical protein [Paenibacillus taichungensis]